MSVRHFLSLLGIVLVLFSLPIETAYARTTVAGAPGAHHLLANPQSPAFVFGLKGGGESVTGPFTVTIYADGRVRLVKRSKDGRVRLVNPSAHIYPMGLTGLLTLAEAEHFFTMPNRTVGKHVVSDVPAAFISVYTTAGVKTVTVRGVKPRRFYELYTVLNYVAGATA